MKKVNKTESEVIISAILLKLQNQNKKIKIDYYDLTLTNNGFYEKCEVAFVKPEGANVALLYEGVTNSYFYLEILETSQKVTKELFLLHTTVDNLIPDELKQKMLWVCGNKKPVSITFERLNTHSFSLIKPKVK